MLVYKIFEKIGDNQYKNLFHNRKTIFSIGDYSIADVKMVYEGYDKITKEKKLYLSGIHVVSSYELCCKYLKRFKNIEDKVILECHVDDNCEIRKKPNGREGVMLAKYIYLAREI